jgi:glutamate 5-kinase
MMLANIDYTGLSALVVVVTALVFGVIDRLSIHRKLSEAAGKQDAAAATLVKVDEAVNGQLNGTPTMVANIKGLVAVTEGAAQAVTDAKDALTSDPVSSVSARLSRIETTLATLSQALQKG